MAVITPFHKIGDQNAAAEPDEKELAMFRKLAESEDIRLLLGSYFLKLAATEDKNVAHPHLEVLTRMAGGRSLACDAQLRLLAMNLDLLRKHDLEKASAL